MKKRAFGIVCPARFNPALKLTLKKAAFAAALLFLAQKPAAQTLHLHLPPDATATFEKATRDLRPRPQKTGDGTYTLRAADTLALRENTRALLLHLHENAHLTASVDSLRALNDSVQTARLYLGPALRWLRLQAPSAGGHARWLSAAGFREKLFADAPLHPGALLRLENELLVQAENNGYPFAGVRLDSLRLYPDGGATAILQVEPGPFFAIRELKLHGNLRLPRAYLPRYLGLPAGSPYSRARVLRIRERLDALLFVETTASPTVSFAGSDATVNLFLQKKRASRFDFIIGLLPRNGSGESGLLLTGSLSAAFLNALGQGERLSLEIERLRPETSKLDVQAGVPYLFGLPFGMDGRLQIFRRDSTWVDAQGELGVQYLLEGGNYVKFFWENKSSSLQKIDSTLLLLTRRLPAALDLRQNGFGLETALSRLDYRFNPRRGARLLLRGTAGFRSVLRNSRIESLRDPAEPEFRFSSLYDSLAGRSTRFLLEGEAEYYVPLFLRSTLKISVRGGGIFSEKPVLANEQYRLGGNKRLRGFDEESLFATRFALATLEYRLLLGQNSFLAAFTDYAYLENVTDRTRLFLRPWGIGAGLNVETRPGIFGISIAVGRRDAGQAMDWRAPKFHLGYVSLF